MNNTLTKDEIEYVRSLFDNVEVFRTKDDAQLVYKYALMLRDGIPGKLEKNEEQSDELLLRVFQFMVYEGFSGELFIPSEKEPDSCFNEYLEEERNTAIDLAMQFKEVFSIATRIYWGRLNPNRLTYEMGLAVLYGVPGVMDLDPYFGIKILECGCEFSGLVGGMDLVEQLSWRDRCLLAMGDSYRTGVVIKDLAAAFTLYKQNYTDHLLQKWKEDEIGDRWYKLYNCIQDDLLQNPDSFEDKVMLSAMMAEGLGCDANPAEALKIHNDLQKQSINLSTVSADVKEIYLDLDLFLLAEKQSEKHPKIFHAEEDIKEGEYVYFGKYNNRSILWKVLSIRNGKAFLLADQALESSYILSHKAWNGDWLSTMSMLDIETEDEDAEYNMALFTKKTIEKDFPDPKDRVCYWRQQALMNYSDEEESGHNVAAPWWLWPEDINDEDSVQYFIDEEGEICEANRGYDLGIRPMIVVNLEK